MKKKPYYYRLELADGTAIEGEASAIVEVMKTQCERDLEQLHLYQLIPMRFLFWQFNKKLPVDHLILTAFLLRALQEELYVEDQTTPRPSLQRRVQGR